MADAPSRRGLIDTSVVIDLERVAARLQRAEATFDPLPVDASVARAYGRIYAAVGGAGRKACGARSLDLRIAATALASDLPPYTRSPDDFRGTEGLVEIVGT